MSELSDRIQQAWKTNSLSHEEYERRLTIFRDDRARNMTIRRAIDNLYRALNPCGQTDDGTFDKGNSCSPRKKGSGKQETPNSKKLPDGEGAERSGVKYMGQKQELEGIPEGDQIRIHDVMTKLSEENAAIEELEYQQLPKKSKGAEAIEKVRQANERAAELISDATTAEIMYVHENGDKNKSGEGWYEAQMEGAMNIMFELYPEMKENKEQQFAFKAILAITSHNQDVVANFEIADELYQAYLKGGNRFSTDFKQGGKANKAMRGKMDLLNYMTDRYGWQEVHNFMMEPVSVREINSWMKERGIPEALFDGVGGELLDYKVAGSVILGPKLGSFYNNLNGSFDSVTMDLWFTRTMGRIGGVATKLNYEGIAKDARALTDAIEWASVQGEGYLLPEGLDWGHHGNPSKAKAKVIAATPVLMDKPTKGDADNDQYNRLFHEGMVEPEVVKGWLAEAAENPRAAAENEELIEWLNSQRLRYGASKIPVLNPDGTPELDKEGKPKTSSFKDKTKLNKDAKRLYLKLKPKKDAPDSGGERKWYRRVMELTKEKLAARGVEMTYADMQAVLWYNEKQLMSQFGFTGKGSETMSYLDAAELLKESRQGK